ncbi:hypothetical protein [Shimazuella kribbensis]|uniref:hypothetical protein n=1 Tax=Shimazuella kribbensis TaxID=139808 RepID=UPI00041E5BA9|nr:hypothetical protein [Shimazuella kribbensis]
MSNSEREQVHPLLRKVEVPVELTDDELMGYVLSAVKEFIKKELIQEKRLLRFESKSIQKSSWNGDTRDEGMKLISELNCPRPVYYEVKQAVIDKVTEDTKKLDPNVTNVKFGSNFENTFEAVLAKAFGQVTHEAFIQAFAS